MRQPCPILQGPYLQDLLAQPGAIEATCRALAANVLGDLADDWAARAFDRIILTGMGSSCHALQSVLPELSRYSLPVLALETSELVHALSGLLTDRTLLVAVSQSGESAEILRLLERMPSGCRLVGITNTPDSALARSSNPALLTAAGSETTVACKTYLASVTTLLWLSAVLSGTHPHSAALELSAAADAMQQYLSDWRSHVDQIAQLLDTARQVFITGRGPSLAAAGQGALTLKEAARFPAEAMSTAAFRHGPMEILSPETAVIVLEGSASVAPLNRNFVVDLSIGGGPVLAVARHSPHPALQLPPVNDRLLPLIEVLPLQMTSLALAALAGREAGLFRLATKVTRAD